MIAVYTDAFLSVLTFEAAADAMHAALRSELGGVDPSRQALALALAKCALETGRFRSIWNYNFGNVKAGATFVGQYCCIELNEVLREKDATGKLVDRVVWFHPTGRLDKPTKNGGKVVSEACASPPGHVQTRMRAFANRFDGAYEYVDFMARGNKGAFAPAFKRMLVGDGAGMVHEMKLKNYFTAPEAPYAAGVVSLQREFEARLAKQPVPETFDPPDAEWERLRSALVGGSWQRAQAAVDVARNEARQP